MFFLPVSGAMDVALGSAAAGVFTNSDWLWEQLHKVREAYETGHLLHNTHTQTGSICLNGCLHDFRQVSSQATGSGECLSFNITADR